MSKIGIHNLGTRLTLSGVSVTAASLSSFTGYMDIAGISAGNTIVSVREVDVNGFSGWYNVGVNVSNAGQGWVALKSTISGAVVTPNFFELDVTTRDADDVYSQVSISQVSGIQTTREFTDSLVLTEFVQGDDIGFFYTPSDSILTSVAGTSGYLMQLRTDDAATTSGSSTLLGVCTVTVPVTGKTFYIVVPGALTDNIIKEGETTRILYGDLSYHVAVGDYKRTLCQFTFNVSRQYTRD
jgi:hypothetical protein